MRSPFSKSHVLKSPHCASRPSSSNHTSLPPTFSLSNHQKSIMAKERIVTCEECGTSSTPLWRKDDRNRNLCNACGIRWKRSLTSKSKKNIVVSGVKRPLGEKKSSPSKISMPFSSKLWATRQQLQAFNAFEQLIAAAETEYEHDFPMNVDQVTSPSPTAELLVPASPAPPSAYASSAEDEVVSSDSEPHLSATLPALPSVLLQGAYPSILTA